MEYQVTSIGGFDYGYFCVGHCYEKSAQFDKPGAWPARHMKWRGL